MLLYFAARRVWNWSILQIMALCIPLLIVEGTFLVANCAKVVQGGWLPLVVGTAIFTIMTTWKTGRYLIRQKFPHTLSLTDFIVSTTSLGRESGLPKRVPGTAVFLAGQPK